MKQKKRRVGPPRKSASARGRTHSKGSASKPDTSTYSAVTALRERLDDGKITTSQFRRLIHLEDMRNEWATRVQLRSIARDLLPAAARQARAGRSRMLAVLGNILLKSEVSDVHSQEAIAEGRLPEEEEAVMREIFEDWSPFLAQERDRRIELRKQRAALVPYPAHNAGPMAEPDTSQANDGYTEAEPQRGA
jgi:hypothetical protein